MRIGIIAALPGEIKPLVRSWEERAANGATRKWTRRDGDSTWITVCAGMGAAAVQRAFAAAEEDGPLSMVLSVGWAGAVVPELQPGDVRLISHVVDARTGEQFRLSGGAERLTLVTTDHVADSEEKARLRAAYRGAVMVDMEAATVLRMAEMRGISMSCVGCIKGISDGVVTRLPDLNQFVSASGQMRMAAFLAHVAMRPQYWRPVMQLGKDSAKAASAMRAVILEFLEGKHVEGLTNNGKSIA